MGPNQNSCLNGPATDLASYFGPSITATSLHRGGVNTAFADGALRFISDAIDIHVWRAVGTRNGDVTNASEAL